MAIPRSLIRKLAIDNIEYTKGLTLSQEPFSFEISETEFVRCYHISATIGKTQKYETFIDIDNENELIENVSCTCKGFSESKGNCKHITALLIKVENDFFSKEFAQKGPSQAIASVTSPAIKDLLNQRAEIIKKRAVYRANGTKALLLPCITRDGNQLYLSFKTGCDKVYTIKNLEEFYENLLYKKTATCGKTDEFLYMTEHFANSELAKFFLEFYPTCAIQGNHKQMRLTPAALDCFMNLYPEKKISIDLQSIVISKEPPVFTLYIKKVNDFYRLNLDKKDFYIFNGQTHHYIQISDILYFCHEEFWEACGDLLTVFSQSDNNYIVSTDKMHIFYNIILKPALQYLRCNADLKHFIPSKLYAKIYIDVNEKKKLIAKTEFSYGQESYPAFDQNRDLDTVLDIEQETKIEVLLKTYFPDPEKEPGYCSCVASEDKLFNLLNEGIPALSKRAELFISNNLKKIKIKSFPKTGMGVRLESGLLQLDMSAGDLSPKELASALLSYRQKKKYVRLRDGSFLLLNSEYLYQLNAITEGVGFTDRDIKQQHYQLPLYRALYLNSIQGISIVKDDNFVQLAEAFSSVKGDEIDVPKDVHGVLRDYQKTGFFWLKALTECGFGGILADDMGLGKTLQILALFSHFKKINGRLCALVVCPSSLVLNWEHEIQKFTPNLSALSLIGSTPERACLLKQINEYDVIITSYDLLKRDLAMYESQLFDFEIVDEAQYIKNHKTQNARAVKTIHSKIRFALTGTPIENGISELWSIFDFLMPGYLYKYPRFRRMFELPVMKEQDPYAMKVLKQMTMPFILRRLKQEVLKELPEKTETILYTRLAPEQEKLYDANLSLMRKELEQYIQNDQDEILNKDRMVILSMLMRLRQLCCDPSLVYERYTEQSAKLDVCMNLVETSIESGHKLLIFSQFTSMLSVIEHKLNQCKIPYYLLTGSTSKEDRMKQVNAFNKDDTPVFLVSLKAGGTGLNLTGADMVIHFDPWWNLSAQNQATDRAHRIGQRNSVQVYKLIAKGTIEEKILALAEKKQNLAETILPDEKNLFKNLTKAQIMDLFNY